MQVTLELPEKVYQSVSAAARESKRQVVDVIIDVVQERYAGETIVPPLADNRPLAEWSNEQVLTAARLRMPKKQSDRHSKLLDKNQAGTITPAEAEELEFFQQIYGAALTRKADGIYEAVRRDLIKSPADLVNG